MPGDSVTIQAGINGATSGDTVLVAAGIYTGDGNRDLTFNGPELTIIDCEGSPIDSHQGISFDNGEDSTAIIQGFTITNADATDWAGQFTV